MMEVIVYRALHYYLTVTAIDHSIFLFHKSSGNG